MVRYPGSGGARLPVRLAAEDGPADTANQIFEIERLVYNLTAKGGKFWPVDLGQIVGGRADHDLGSAKLTVGGQEPQQLDTANAR
jgi:hypothetical protein